MPKGGKRSRNGKSQKGHLRVVRAGDTAVALSPDVELWEAQPDETPKAYDAFRRYRDMDPDVRSVQRAQAEAGENAAHLRTWEGWSAKWSWVDRALAWDEEQDRVRRQAALDEVKAMSKRHARAAQAYLTAMLEPVRSLLEEIRADPDFFGDMVRSDRSGALDIVAKLAKVLPIVTNVERLALGEPISLEAFTVDSPEEAREGARAILSDPEAARLAGQLVERLYGAG